MSALNSRSFFFLFASGEAGYVKAFPRLGDDLAPLAQAGLGTVSPFLQAQRSEETWK